MQEDNEINPHLEYSKSELIAKALEAVGYLTIGLSLVWALVIIVVDFSVISRYFYAMVVFWLGLILALHTIFRYSQNRTQVDIALLLEAQKESIDALNRTLGKMDEKPALKQVIKIAE